MCCNASGRRGAQQQRRRSRLARQVEDEPASLDDGRVLTDVEASVAPSQIAPILLGLGALNRLGAFKIEEGRLVFAGERPA
jgi:hypothetical protein